MLRDARISLNPLYPKIDNAAHQKKNAVQKTSNHCEFDAFLTCPCAHLAKMLIAERMMLMTSKAIMIRSVAIGFFNAPAST